MQTLLQDVRFGARVLLKHPMFTLIAIFTLALGIGANTAIFTVINVALFKPLPIAQEDRVVVLREIRPDDKDSSAGASYLNFQDWQTQSNSFASLALVAADTATFKAVGEPMRVQSAIVSADFFKTIGVAPLLGRSFDASDERGSGSEGLNAVMLSHSGWQKHFGGDPKVLGRQVIIEEKPFQVIGVTPPDIIPVRPEPVDFWVTTAVNGDPADPGSVNGSRNFRAYAGVVARLKPGVTLAQAEAELAGLQNSLKERYPKVIGNRVINLTPVRELFVRDARKTLWLLLGIVGAVLLIACVNVTNVLLARATTRQREIAIRSALGANRWLIVQQLLIESLLLALAGGVLGVVLSLWLVDGLSALLPSDVPQLTGLRPDWRVLLFTLLAAVVTGVLCGLIPALSATRGNLAETIKDGGRSISGGKWSALLRNALVVGEVAIALVLLTGAGLLVNSLLRLQRVNPGFRTDHTLTMQMTLSGDRYQDRKQPAARINAFLAELSDRVSRLPGVTDVAHAQCVPLTGVENNTGFQIVDQVSSEKPSAQLRFIGNGYFRTLGIPLVAGRDFNPQDAPDSPPVMLINEAFAREHFHGENPLGKRLKLGWGGNGPKEIVGIVGNVRHRSLSDAARAEMYVPQAQFDNAGITLIVRTQTPPENLVNAVKQQVRELDPALPITDVKTLAAYRHEALALPRFTTMLLGIFAGLAVGLALVGLYGVMSYSVSQRTQEIGVRMALGAQAGDVLRMVVWQGLRLAGAGVLLGLAGALALTRLLQSLVYEISTNDPLTLTVVALLFAIVALGACYFPARRATKVDPLVALRYE